ncbi:hypothetical protein LCGC14_3161900, partial [marine sediment metagenome]
IPLPEGSNAADMIRRLRAIDAEFFGTLYANAGIIGGDVTIEGTLTGNDILSSNWDGAIPVDLSSRDATATVGYALDGSVGAAQFQNIFAEGGELRNLSVLGNLTMGANGIIRSAASGLRYELEATTTYARINFFTGDANEASAGFLRQESSGGSSILRLWAPAVTGGSISTINILASDGLSISSDGGKIELAATGLTVQSTLGNMLYGADTAGKQHTFYEGSAIDAAQGSVGAPLLAVPNDLNTGAYWPAADTFRITAGGTAYLEASSTLTVAMYNIASHASHPFLRRSSATGQVFYDSSTRDIKENIVPLPRLGNIIDRLVPVSFTLIDDPSA